MINILADFTSPPLAGYTLAREAPPAAPTAAHTAACRVAWLAKRTKQLPEAAGRSILFVRKCLRARVEGCLTRVFTFRGRAA